MNNGHVAFRLTVDDDEETLVTKTIDAENIDAYLDTFVSFLMAAGFKLWQLENALEARTSKFDPATATPEEVYRYTLTPEGEAWLERNANKAMERPRDRVDDDPRAQPWPFPPVETPLDIEADAAECGGCAPPVFVEAEKVWQGRPVLIDPAEG